MKSVSRIVALFLAGPAIGCAALYDVAVGDFNATRASLRMNLPASLKAVRGIYFWGNGGVGDSRNRATDPEMVALADMLGFALVASSGVALVYPESAGVGDVPSFEAALAEFARGSGHPELVRAPLLPIGHSNGAGTNMLTNVFKTVGAFSMNATSKDAALLVTLPPGSYSAQVSGVGGVTGVALVEIYEVP